MATASHVAETVTGLGTTTPVMPSVSPVMPPSPQEVSSKVMTPMTSVKILKRGQTTKENPEPVMPEELKPEASTVGENDEAVRKSTPTGVLEPDVQQSQVYLPKMAAGEPEMTDTSAPSRHSELFSSLSIIEKDYPQ